MSVLSIPEDLPRDTPDGVDRWVLDTGTARIQPADLPPRGGANAKPILQEKHIPWCVSALELEALLFLVQQVPQLQEFRSSCMLLTLAA